MLVPPTIEDIRAAAERIDGAIVRTPMLMSRTLSEIIGAEVWLKFENLQFTAAYKERGALNKLLQLTPEEHRRGVIAASAGNHAQAVAYHGKRLGTPVTIVMPVSTPTIKVTQTEGHGANVILVGERFDDAHAHARQLEAERGLVFVHPFDDPAVIAGAGTVALELLAAAPDLDVLVIPIGGGGLISGIATAAKAIKPDIEHAVALLVGIEKTVVEGAGAAGLAAILANPERYRGRKVATVLCGGNIDTHLLANVLVRDLVRQGRIARLRVNAEDRPGALAAITAKFHDAGVNIIEINH